MNLIAKIRQLPVVPQALLLNVAAFFVYTLLYFIFNEEWYEDGFPVGLAVYFSTHAAGLLIMSVVQRALRHPKWAMACFLSAWIVLGVGGTFAYFTY